MRVTRQNVLGAAVAAILLGASAPVAGAVTLGRPAAEPLGACDTGGASIWVQAGVYSGNPYVAPSAGVVTAFSSRLYYDPAPHARYVVMRPVSGIPGEGDHLVVGTSATITLPTSLPTVPVTTNVTPFAVQAGDTLGMWEDGPTICQAAGPGEDDMYYGAPEVPSPGDIRNLTIAAPGLLTIGADFTPDTVKPTAPTFAGAYLRVVQSSGAAPILSGGAKDNVGVASVKVRVRASTSGGSFDRTYTATLSSSGFGATNVTWSLNLRTLTPALPVGTYTTEITTTDLTGKASTATAGPALVKVS